MPQAEPIISIDKSFELISFFNFINEYITNNEADTHAISFLKITECRIATVVEHITIDATNAFSLPVYIFEIEYVPKRIDK